MKRLHVEDLRPGMIPARDILLNGTLLLRGRRPLNQDVIERLQRSNYRHPIVVDEGEPFPIKRSSSGSSVPVLERAHGEVELEGDVYIELFADEESSIFVWGNLAIRGDVLPYATIICTGSLHVSGQAMGATLVAGGELTVGMAGSLNGHRTMLAVMDYEGIGWLLRRDDLFQEQRNIQVNLEKIDGILGSYARRKAKGIALQVADREYLDKVLRLQRALRARYTRLEQQLGQERSDPVPQIRIFRSVRPHVLVRMSDIMEEIPAREQGCLIRHGAERLEIIDEDPVRR